MVMVQAIIVDDIGWDELYSRAAGDVRDS